MLLADEVEGYFEEKLGREEPRNLRGVEDVWEVAPNYDYSSNVRLSTIFCTYDIYFWHLRTFVSFGLFAANILLLECLI